METTGINGAANAGAINLDQGTFAPANANGQGISPEFVQAATAVGQEQIDSGLAPAGSNPYDLFLQSMAVSLISIVNISNFDFDTSSE